MMNIKLPHIKDKLRNPNNREILILFNQSISYCKSLSNNHINCVSAKNPINFETVNYKLDYFLMNSPIARTCMKIFLYECFTVDQILLISEKFNLVYNPEIHNTNYLITGIINHCFSIVGLSENIVGKRKIILL